MRKQRSYVTVCGMRTVCGAQDNCSEAPQREKWRPGIVPWQGVEQCHVTLADVSVTFSTFISLKNIT
jgi:hypothetical protein